MQCPNGHDVAPGTRFCPSCGVPVTASRESLHESPGDPRKVRSYVLGLVAGLALAAVAGLAWWWIGPDESSDDPTSVAATSPSGSSRTAALPPAPSLTDIYETCSADDITGTLSLADEGRTVLIDTGSEYGDTQPMRCLFSQLGTSDALVAQIADTTALMGRVQAVEHLVSY